MLRTFSLTIISLVALYVLSLIPNDIFCWIVLLYVVKYSVEYGIYGTRDTGKPFEGRRILELTVALCYTLITIFILPMILLVVTMLVEYWWKE